MPDATEWLVESRDQDGEPAYEHCSALEGVHAHIRKLFDDGFREVYVYQRVPFTVQVDVTVNAPRKRRRKESTEGAASPRAEEPTTKDAAAQEPATSPVAVPADPTASLVRLAQPARKEVGDAPGSVTPTTEGAARLPAPSSVAVFSCEARFDKDPACPGPAEFDAATKGRFCGFHLAQVPEGHRREMHRLHGHRNRPNEPIAKVA